MTKSELIQTLADRKGLTRNDAAVVVETIFGTISESLESGGRCELRGFGSFSLKTREARVGRNPKTGDKVQVEEKNIPFFKAGKALRERVDR